MGKPYVVKFRVSRAHYERLKEEANNCGFRYISEYIRDRILGRSLYLERTVAENNKLLKQFLEHLKNVSKKISSPEDF